MDDAQKLREGMAEIYRVAITCKNELQGPLADDEHRRAFRALDQIATTAAMVLFQAA